MISKSKFNLSTIYFNPTQHCNLFCKHCWLSPAVVKNKNDYIKKIKNEITPEDLKPAVDQAMELGLKGIKITGGEPFLRPDILDFIELFYKKGLSIMIETNGTLINEKTVKALKAFNVSMISVSIDSSSGKDHDGFRGLAGAFKKTIKAVKLLSKYSISTQIIFSLYRGNISQLKKVIALSVKLGVDSIKINPITLMGRGIKLKQKGQILTVKELLEVKKEIENRFLNKKGPVVLFDLPIAFCSIKSIKQSAVTGSISRCNILNIVGILADGSISFCGVANKEKNLILGNIKTGDIKKIWRENNVFKKMRKEIPFKFEGVCQKCIMKYVCLGNCRAEVYSHKRNFVSSYSFCEEAYQAGLFPGSRLMR